MTPRPDQGEGGGGGASADIPAGGERVGGPECADARARHRGVHQGGDQRQLLQARRAGQEVRYVQIESRIPICPRENLSY